MEGTTQKNSCKTAAVMNLLSRGSEGAHSAKEADHIQRVQPPQVRDIETITAEILDAKRVGGEAILTIGKGLIEAKAMLPHGEWLPWLEDQVEFSERSARNLMRLARDWTNRQALADLGATKALQLLALPESERDEFLNEPHEVGGERKNVIDMTSRELAIAIKERDDALRTAAQAQADQSAAEQARDELSKEMKLANERIAGLNAEVEKRSAEASKAQETAARLEQELDELRSQPRDVAVEVDEAAVEAARKEAEERMQAQMDAAKKAQNKAEKARKAAEDAKAEAQMEVIKANTMLEEARRQAEDAQRQAEEARKKAAVTTDPDLVLFSELLDQAQTLVKRMGGVRLKKKAKDPDTAEKLQAAMMALSTAVKEAAWQ